mmetsp:Transcript_33417/g.106553  ORF Transcript_33417/g.106553 Transcript_33417/m.106553 type:complete len:279 (-) Transcript_33417:106-942(-)
MAVVRLLRSRQGVSRPRWRRALIRPVGWRVSATRRLSASRSSRPSLRSSPPRWRLGSRRASPRFRPRWASWATTGTPHMPAATGGVAAAMAGRPPPGGPGGGGDGFSVDLPAGVAAPVRLFSYAVADLRDNALVIVPSWKVNELVGTLTLLVAPNPQLKAGLSEVALTVSIPAAPSPATASQPALDKAAPDGEWDQHSRQLRWQPGTLHPGRPTRFTATFRAGPFGFGPTPPSVNVHFSHRGATLTMLVPKPDAADAAVIAPTVDRRFRSGEYQILCG